MAKRSVLVLEDEYLIAVMVAEWVSHAGYRVVGPVANTGKAQALITDNGIDAALLDVQVAGGDRSFGLTGRLQAMRIPFAFLTSYSRTLLPRDFDAVPCLAKPTTAEAIAEVLGELLPDC